MSFVTLDFLSNPRIEPGEGQKFCT